MITIWKCEISLADEFTVEMPSLSEILCVQVQKGRPVIWAIIDTENALIHRKFRCIGTGTIQWDQELEQMEYIGTVQLDGVWHLFSFYL
jgi:hypothetical protein